MSEHAPTPLDFSGHADERLLSRLHAKQRQVVARLRSRRRDREKSATILWRCSQAFDCRLLSDAATQIANAIETGADSVTIELPALPARSDRTKEFISEAMRLIADELDQYRNIFSQLAKEKKQ
jgi:hypothetical protein